MGYFFEYKADERAYYGGSSDAERSQQYELQRLRLLSEVVSAKNDVPKLTYNIYSGIISL